MGEEFSGPFKVAFDIIYGSPSIQMLIIDVVEEIFGYCNCCMCVFYESINLHPSLRLSVACIMGRGHKDFLRLGHDPCLFSIDITFQNTYTKSHWIARIFKASVI